MTADVDEYAILEEPPTVETFVALRSAAEMAPRSLEAVEAGLPNSTHAVTAVYEPTGEVVGMGRIVGDGATVYHICDMAVHPDHQGRGIGSLLMDALWSFIDETAPEGAYVSLLADVDGFYERFGFEETRPASKGMYRRVERTR